MPILKNKNIAFKLSALILTCATAIFLVIFGYNYLFSRELVMKCAEDHARSLTDSSVNKIENVLNSLEKSCQNLVFLLENSPLQTEGSIERILELVVSDNKDIYGSAVAFEPFAFDESRKFFAPYVYVDDGKIKKQYLGNSSYNYFLLDWYQIPKELRKPIWSEPYFDEGGGNILMATYSAPFYRTEGGEKRFMGIATVDVSLVWLKNMVSEIHMYETGFGFLLSPQRNRGHASRGSADHERNHIQRGRSPEKFENAGTRQSHDRRRNRVYLYREPHDRQSGVALLRAAAFQRLVAGRVHTGERADRGPLQPEPRCGDPGGERASWCCCW